SVQEHMDTTTFGGKLIFHIFGALAEFEREVIRERTNAGLQAARTRGRLGGRPTIQALDPTKVALARKLYADGSTPVQEIAPRSISAGVRCIATCGSRPGAVLSFGAG